MRLLVLLVLLVGCGPDDRGFSGSGGDLPDPVDPVQDAGPPVDAGPEPQDAGVDGGVDAGTEWGGDAGVDAGSEDAGVDAGPEWKGCHGSQECDAGSECWIVELRGTCVAVDAGPVDAGVVDAVACSAETLCECPDAGRCASRDGGPLDVYVCLFSGAVGACVY